MRQMYSYKSNDCSCSALNNILTDSDEVWLIKVPVIINLLIFATCWFVAFTPKTNTAINYGA